MAQESTNTQEKAHMMKKTLIAASLTISGMFGAAPAAYAEVIGFTDGFGPGNWTTTLTGTPAGGGAPVGAANNGSTLTLTGGDSGCNTGQCSIRYTIVIPGPDHHILFHWDYNSTDSIGPGGDFFGYSVNGLLTQLSDNGSGQLHQFGDQLVKLDIGSQFGFYIDCFDCIGGNAVVGITNFKAVPEPGSLALLGLGLAGLAGLRRSRLA